MPGEVQNSICMTEIECAKMILNIQNPKDRTRKTEPERQNPETAAEERHECTGWKRKHVMKGEPEIT